MTRKDLKRLDLIKKRLDNMPDVLDLRIKKEWEKLSKDDHDLLCKVYLDLDDLLTETKAFMSVKFPDRKDLVQIWNNIDFDPKIGPFKIHTNAPESIRSAWQEGMFDFYSFIKTMRAEVLIKIEDSEDSDSLNNNSNKNIKYTNIFNGNVKNFKHKASNNQAEKMKILQMLPSKSTLEHKVSISWQRKAIIISIITAVLGLTFSYLMHKNII